MHDVPFTDDELLAYLDEMLPVEKMAELERQLRSSDELRRKAAAVAQRRENGAHTVAQIWRTSRLSCPTRSRLGSFLLGTLEAELTECVEFHVRTVGCRYCAANLQDLEAELDRQPETKQRRRKFYESSAGYLRGADDE